MFLMEERDIALNIRLLREARGMTLTRLAQQTKLTKGAISKIETAQVSPPVSTLLRIATALNVPLARLFAEDTTDPSYVLTRRGKGRVITRDGTQFGYSYAALALEAQHKSIEPFLLSIKPGNPVGRFQHEGEEFIYMLDGQLEFTVGDSRMLLHAGDSLYFNPTLVHTTRVLGRKTARFICVFVQERRTNSTTRNNRRRS
jgi:transcriptional regulator with XRE-family HTH domain